MDLLEEMNVYESNISDETGATTGSGYIKIEDAIIVAEKYAKDMCEKQRVICESVAHKHWVEYSSFDGRLITPAIVEAELLDAPLATEK